MIDRDIALLLVGAGISLASTLITIALQHFLSLREHDIKQKRELKQQEAKDLRAKLTLGIDEKPSVTCPACNTIHPYGIQFCSTCGARLPYPMIANNTSTSVNKKQNKQDDEMDRGKCKNCGHMNSGDSSFCSKCGSILIAK